MTQPEHSPFSTILGKWHSSASSNGKGPSRLTQAPGRLLDLPGPMACMVEWRVGWPVNGRQAPGHQGAPPRSPCCPALTIAELITGTRMLEGKNKTIPSFGWEPGHCLQDPTVFLKCDGASLRLRWCGPGLSEHCSQRHGSSLLPGEGGPEKNPEQGGVQDLGT